MPNYEKVKRRRKSFFRKKKLISMRPSGSSQTKEQPIEGGFRVMDGGRFKRKIKWLVFGGIAFVLVLSGVLISFLSPTGLIETVRNLDGTFWPTSSWPVDLSGTQLYRACEQSRYFYALSDTSVGCYSKQGRRMLHTPHGFAKPIMSVNGARCLVYDQNGTGLKVLSADRLQYQFSAEYPIYVACMGRNGTFAVATKAENYTSMVTVYGKNRAVLYQWFCPTDMVTGLALAGDGKTLAVSSVRSENGNYFSTVQVLRYQSATPVFSYSYPGELITGLQNGISYGFCAIGSDRVDIFDWKHFERLEQHSDYHVAFVRTAGKQVLSCFVRQSDSAGARITVYNNKQSLTADFELPVKVDDIRLCGKHILVLSGNRVLLYDRAGVLQRQGSVGFGTDQVIPVTTDHCLGLTDHYFEKISLTQEE